MHLFSTLHSGYNPPRVLSGCSRNHVIYCTYFCDCLGYTDTSTLHFKTNLHQGWGGPFRLLVLTFNYNLCGCGVMWTFPMTQTAMEVRENQFSVWPVKLESKVISCALQGGQNQYLGCCKKVCKCLASSKSWSSLDWSHQTRWIFHFISQAQAFHWSTLEPGHPCLVLLMERSGQLWIDHVQPTPPGSKGSAGWLGSSPLFLTWGLKAKWH